MHIPSIGLLDCISPFTVFLAASRANVSISQVYHRLHLGWLFWAMVLSPTAIQLHTCISFSHKRDATRRAKVAPLHRSASITPGFLSLTTIATCGTPSTCKIHGLHGNIQTNIFSRVVQPGNTLPSHRRPRPPNHPSLRLLPDRAHLARRHLALAHCGRTIAIWDRFGRGAVVAAR